VRSPLSSVDILRRVPSSCGGKRPRRRPSASAAGCATPCTPCGRRGSMRPLLWAPNPNRVPRHRDQQLICNVRPRLAVSLLTRCCRGRQGGKDAGLGMPATAAGAKRRAGKRRTPGRVVKTFPVPTATICEQAGSGLQPSALGPNQGVTHECSGVGTAGRVGQ